MGKHSHITSINLTAIILTIIVGTTITSCDSCGGNDKPVNAPTKKQTKQIVKNDSVGADTTEVDADTMEVDADSLELEIDSTEIKAAEREKAIEDSLRAERQFIKEHFVELKSLIPDIVEDIRYAGNNNFVGKKIDGYDEPVAILTKEAAEALKEVADELRPKGFRLKVFDAYRPKQAVEQFRKWVGVLADTIKKSDYYPQKNKSVLFKEGYISSRSKHCRGSSIDMTLCNKDGDELDMGGSFDLFSETSGSSYTETLTERQIDNRSLLRTTMEKHGFAVANSEWWHFYLVEEPFTDKEFEFHVLPIAKLTEDPKAKAKKEQQATKPSKPKTEKVKKRGKKSK